MDEHRDIILEALADYRIWWSEQDSDESSKDKVREIDEAIYYVQLA